MTSEEHQTVDVEVMQAHADEEIPEAFTGINGRVAVVELVDRWSRGETCYFRVRGDDDTAYLLCHDHAADHWYLETPGEDVPGGRAR